MKRIIQRLRENLNDLEAELNQSSIGKPTNVPGLLLQNETSGHGETKKELEAVQLENERLRVQLKTKLADVHDPLLQNEISEHAETKRTLEAVQMENDRLQGQLKKKPASVHDQALQDERGAHAETRRKLELIQVEIKNLRLRRTPQPGVIVESPDIDHAANLKAETKKRDVEIRQLKRETESLQEQRTGLQGEIDALGIDLQQSNARFGKVGDELIGYRKAKYPVVIEERDAEIKRLKDKIDEMLGTIKKQRVMINSAGGQ